MAVASCLIGYGEVGLWLKRKVEQGVYKLEGNPYRRWIETYCGEEFLSAIRVGIGTSLSWYWELWGADLRQPRETDSS